MHQDINKLITVVENAEEWILATKSMVGAKGESARRTLINYRRQLKRKKRALDENPAAAIYGESQMGKSYLVGSLLSEDGKPFTIVDGNGDEFEFIQRINPRGDGTESTSLATRFSANQKILNADFPIKAKLLSPTDLILVICDSYYNDIKVQADIAIKNDAISTGISQLVSGFHKRTKQQKFITEDDIWDIYDYFKDNFPIKSTNVISSSFFEVASTSISKVRVEEWGSVFSYLWNENKELTKLFHELVAQYNELDFVDEVYLPIESVLLEYGTLLDVARLHELYGGSKASLSQYRSHTSLVFLDKDGATKSIKEFSKSYLCALVSELIFGLPEKLKASKPFLRNTDLLDFPGARSRLNLNEQGIEDNVIPQMLLRGKVAYLFNKYSRSEKVNILLLCHNHRHTGQSTVPGVMDEWVKSMIGNSPEERELFLNRSKVSPLFVISTMFNEDLGHDLIKDRYGDHDALNRRWDNRFIKVLKREIFSSETNSWFQNWTIKDQNFRNIYLLRDFYYSSENKSKIFKGYNETQTETEEILPSEYPSFRKDLRESFLSFEFVRNHFNSPEIAWDEAATINKDGTQLIIANLTLASNNIQDARVEKMLKELNDISQGILTELKKHYHDSDADSRLLKAKETAGGMQMKLDISFGQNPYFFGQMMSEFMLSESKVYEVYHNILKDIERKDVVNLDKYSAIRTSVPDLNSANSFEVNLELLCRQYEYSSKEICRAEMEQMGIDLNELFYGDHDRVKNFSQILAESLETYWFESHLTERKAAIAKFLSEDRLYDFLGMLRQLFRKLNMSNRIAGIIRNYVDGHRNLDDAYGMIADISAELINKFINTIGWEFFSEGQIEELTNANEKSKLGLVLKHDDLFFDDLSAKEAAVLITQMGDLPKLLNHKTLPKSAQRLPNYRNYVIWRDLVKVGFVAVSDIPNYDPVANKNLGSIISESTTVKFS
jgi:hypothetical protein